MPPSTSADRWTRVAVVIAIAFAALNAVNAVNKGGDADVFLEGGRRLLQAEPLYEGSSAAAGFIGPPFQAVFFAPFAAVAPASPIVAKLLWHLTGIACLILGVVITARAWAAARGDLGLPFRPTFPAAFVPLLAVLLPLQTNFEHQNMNPLLLALLAGATWMLARGADGSAGALLGIAIALKAFPALLLIVLVCRQYWRAAAVAVAVAIGLTLLPLPLYGAGYLQLLRDFQRLASSGFPARSNNQSLFAAFDRLLGPGDGDFIHQPEGATLVAYSLTAGVLVLALTIAALRARNPPTATLTIQLFTALVVAILLSPIAWDHYWVLAFPALVVLYDSRDERLLGGGPGLFLFVATALLITGVSRVLLGRQVFSLARSLSPYAIAAVLMVAALLWICMKVRGSEATEPHERSGAVGSPRASV